MLRPLRLLCAAALACASAACSSVDRHAGLRDLATGDFAGARAFHEALLAEEPQDEALDRNEAGVAALLQGDVAGAHVHFREAYDELDDLSSSFGETVSGALRAENRRWKGEPYERCMNAYYLGVTYWLQGDVDNAAACFKAGLLRDGDSAEGFAQSDFALLWFLLGEAQRAAAHEDRGAAALARAHDLVPKNPWTAPARATEGNVVVLVETGFGPARVPTGPHGADVTFARRAGGAPAYRVRLGGRDLGLTAPLGDVYVQAITRGSKVIDHINEGKAVFKDAAVIGGAIVLQNSGSRTSDALGAALILAGLLTPSQTDMRCWASLPDQVQTLVAELPEGRSTLTFEPADAAGRAGGGGAWSVPVDVARGRVTLAWTRTLD